MPVASRENIRVRLQYLFKYRFYSKIMTILLLATLVNFLGLANKEFPPRFVLYLVFRRIHRWIVDLVASNNHRSMLWMSR